MDININIKNLLEAAADCGTQGLYIYSPGQVQQSAYYSYLQLRSTAVSNARLLRQLNGFAPGKILLLHFNNHWDNVVWFWSVLYAGGVPAMSTPFVNSVEGRKAHIKHLFDVLGDPICLTRQELLDRDFSDTAALRVTCVESLSLDDAREPESACTDAASDDQTALLMLTSGSTGNAKVVCLTHSNLQAAVRTKTSARQTAPDSTYLNFIGLDHVAALVEIHLHALYLGVSQVHVPALDVVASPLVFVRLISKHRVSRSFAPNFFFVKLTEAMRSAGEELVAERLDLSCLSYLASGGEANNTATVDALSIELSKFGAPRNAIISGFGMTETCAGAIFNLDCPAYDLKMDYEFACVGRCTPGIKMRITPSHNIDHSDETLNDENQSKTSRELFSGVGSLEVKGAVVFQGYLNNAEANKSSFTDDGWFKTGDQAIIDQNGYLCLAGRSKETMAVNGVKYLPCELESAMEQAALPGVEPTFTVCFAVRPNGAPTEQICVVYCPTYKPQDIKSRIRALDGINKIVTLHTGSKPRVLPLDTTCFQKSTLGKLSRGKIKTAFQQGKYESYQQSNDKAVHEYRQSIYSPPVSSTEKIVSHIFTSVLGLAEDELGVDVPYFDTGVTSIDLIRLKRLVEERFELRSEIPMIVFMTQSTIRNLAAVVDSTISEKKGPAYAYDPIVTLQHAGQKTPLFLFHPGVGEILVFLGLIKFLDDRPVYALRARGFNDGESFFGDLGEIVDTYCTAIREKQPHGPYAIAGYSWGSMIAFEVAKKLEADGREVRFLGAFNLPPHIKLRMRQFDWAQCLVHLAYFAGLISEDITDDVIGQMRLIPSKQQSLDYLIEISSHERLRELGLSHESLSKWADVAYSLQSLAVDYEPSGRVQNMDVFYCQPLAVLQLTKQQWLDQQLRKWDDFVEKPAYHPVNGAHYTMLSPEHVHTFQRRFQEVLRIRGV